MFLPFGSDGFCFSWLRWWWRWLHPSRSTLLNLCLSLPRRPRNNALYKVKFLCSTWRVVSKQKNFIPSYVSLPWSHRFLFAPACPLKRPRGPWPCNHFSKLRVRRVAPLVLKGSFWRMGTSRSKHWRLENDCKDCPEPTFASGIVLPLFRCPVDGIQHLFRWCFWNRCRRCFRNRCGHLESETALLGGLIWIAKSWWVDHSKLHICPTYIIDRSILF